MFIFIGGIQPKTKTLEESPRLCPVCGLARAWVQRVDHHLSLFFIPLFRVKKGEPMLVCDRCGVVGRPDESGGFNGPEPQEQEVQRNRCPSCGEPVKPSFSYCPHCGERL